ncbi:PucR family transcriptional regulator [Geodermatophilus nigrescens]|uniref:PucR C-terminal helix-turn-helix domain-containing protein n=1 Tax=Geodermatophilus nigrescens TaxID=1070870 RepID=A0A1M5D9N2_9ACTN|nr:helix-turn-helix domain-containing protein [Geodermatophilus nigrescens]SHF63560.1 PucR C-terminal helix-turn-helix domain-containing protein [Geodermatophilus nigrescens]
MHTAPGGVTERLAEMVPALLEQLDAMTDRMVEVLVETEPPYREAMQSGDPLLRTTLRRNLEVGIRGLLPDVPAAYYASHAEGARAVGRLRAAQGIPLEAVLRAYRLGGQITWEALVALSRNSGRHDDGLLLEVAGSLWRTNDRGCSAAAEGYRAEERRRAGLDVAERRRLVDGLLDGRGGDPAFVRQASELLAVPLGGRLAVVVAHPAEDRPEAADPAQALLKRGIRSAWGTRAQAQVGVVALGTRRLPELLGWLGLLATGPVGVSPVVEGAAAVAGAYRLAETAARTLPPGTARVVTTDDRLPEALLSDSPEIAERLVGQTLGRLLELPEDEREVLLETLSAFLDADGSPTRAADLLYCHRNTVMHRLRRIESVTGRKPTDPRARLLWQLALLATGHHDAGTRRPVRDSA